MSRLVKAGMIKRLKGINTRKQRNEITEERENKGREEEKEEKVDKKIETMNN